MNPMLEKLFKEAQVQEAKNAVTNGSGRKKRSEDPRFIHFVPGNTYRLRLIFGVPAEGSGRTKPFIHKYTHGFADQENKFYWITCPTSEYVLGKKGFKECPVCEDAHVDYQEGKKGSASAWEMYNIAKRQFNGYATAYVVSDPSCKANEGFVKLFRYGVTIADFLKWQVYGVHPKTGEKNPDVIGLKAFQLQDGLDLIITVTEITDPDGKKFPKYGLDFARNPSTINILDDAVQKQVAELQFDKEFYTHSSKEEILKFMKALMKAEVADTAIDVPNKESAQSVNTNTGDGKKEEAPVGAVSNKQIDDLLGNVNAEYNK